MEKIHYVFMLVETARLSEGEAMKLLGMGRLEYRKAVLEWKKDLYGFCEAKGIDLNDTFSLAANDYQRAANRTLIDKPDFDITDHQTKVSGDVLSIGIATCELAELLKKGIFHQKGVDWARFQESVGSALSDLERIQYAKEAKNSLKDEAVTNSEVMLLWNVLGLLGESGELADLVDNYVYSGLGLDDEKAKKELGDVLWYVAALCKLFGFTMEEVMRHNIEKLKARYPDGYTAERSNFREGLAQ